MADKKIADAPPPAPVGDKLDLFRDRSLGELVPTEPAEVSREQQPEHSVIELAEEEIRRHLHPASQLRVDVDIQLTHATGGAVRVAELQAEVEKSKAEAAKANAQAEAEKVKAEAERAKAAAENAKVAAEKANAEASKAQAAKSQFEVPAVEATKRSQEESHRHLRSVFVVAGALTMMGFHPGLAMWIVLLTIGVVGTNEGAATLRAWWDRKRLPGGDSGNRPELPKGDDPPQDPPTET